MANIYGFPIDDYAGVISYFMRTDKHQYICISEADYNEEYPGCVPYNDIAYETADHTLYVPLYGTMIDLSAELLSRGVFADRECEQLYFRSDYVDITSLNEMVCKKIVGRSCSVPRVAAEGYKE